MGLVAALISIRDRVADCARSLETLARLASERDARERAMRERPVVGPFYDDLPRGLGR